MAVHFFFADASVTLKQRGKLKKFIESIFKKEGRVPGNINYIFCSDEYLLNINRQYLSHDYYTDIITFDISSGDALADAEIYISVDRVRENASLFRQTIQHELHRVLFHGVLHLCGFNDKSKREKGEMRQKETFYIDRYLK